MALKGLGKAAKAKHCVRDQDKQLEKMQPQPVQASWLKGLWRKVEA